MASYLRSHLPRNFRCPNPDAQKKTHAAWHIKTWLRSKRRVHWVHGSTIHVGFCLILERDEVAWPQLTTRDSASDGVKVPRTFVQLQAAVYGSWTAAGYAPVMAFPSAEPTLFEVATQANAMSLKDKLTSTTWNQTGHVVLSLPRIPAHFDIRDNRDLPQKTSGEQKTNQFCNPSNAPWA